MKIATRWATTEHECPHCEKMQADDGVRSGELWICIACDKSYILGEV